MTPDAAAQLDVPRGNVIEGDPRSRGDARVGEQAHPGLIHRPELDGIRGLAILLVLAGHAYDPLEGLGFAGVGLFFVLSGYLITGNLRAGGSKGSFYLRRAARLFPALVITLVAMVVLGNTVLFLPSVLYVANWPIGLGWLGPDRQLFGHMWSLSIEEQFYLVWPWLLPFVRVRWLVAIALAVIALRFVIDPNIGYFSTPFRLDGLLLGAALALSPAIRLPRVAGVLAVLIMLGIGQFTGTAAYAPVLAATTIVSVALVVVAPRWLTPLAPLGRISYSLYLFHYPLVLTLGPAAGIPIAIALAAASTVLIEEPIRHRVRAWEQGRAPVAALAG